MSYMDFPWPTDHSFMFPHRDQVFEYLQAYMKRFGVEKCLRLSTRVDSVRKVDSIESNENKKHSQWNVKWTDLKTNENSSQCFDCVIVATGLNCEPLEPDVENRSEFKGLVMHSIDYRHSDINLKGYY